MSTLESLKPKNVFKYFEEISAIPRGSGNMNLISDYCEGFAKANNLKHVRDTANNIIIYKPASKDCKNKEPIILQGHLDMVCQKNDGCDIDFSKDGIKLLVKGDFITAKGTTLGADNGIAVAMILAILADKEISHPPIEAVFTTDEEIGMIGAGKLDMKLLSSKRMINLDSEEDDVMTVSCAGGSDFRVSFDIDKKSVQGKRISVILKGLQGGHSGVEINKGRVNANILAGRFLNYMKNNTCFDIISVNGGDKANAIPNKCVIDISTSQVDDFVNKATYYLNLIKNEIYAREENFSFDIKVYEEGEYKVLTQNLRNNIIYTLLTTPNGVMYMSAEIEGLVETSLNLGILETQEEKIIIHYALRSNKQTALDFLEDKLKGFFAAMPCNTEVFGHYPPWEFKPDSKLQELYKQLYLEHYGFPVKAEAIHAGLECSVFASSIKGIDCIAIGPSMWNVHTTLEKLSISSTEKLFGLILKLLKNL